MKLSLAAGSLILLGLAVIFLIALTFFESALLGMSPTAERIISLLGLVLPSALGAVLGALSLIRREGRAWLAVAGLVLNSLFALFHLMVILFAG